MFRSSRWRSRWGAGLLAALLVQVSTGWAQSAGNGGPPATSREWWPGTPDTLETDAPRIWVSSRPYGAEVWAGERKLGTTPLWVDPSSLEGPSLALIYPGVPVRSLDLSSVEGTVVEVDLAPGQLPGLSSTAGGRGRSSFRGTRAVLGYGLVFLGAGSAALGLHFKERADEAYDNYLRTGNVRRMGDAFDEAERYDRYSLGCWVVAEVSLIGLLYMLVRSPASEAWSLETDPQGVSRLRVGVQFW